MADRQRPLMPEFIENPGADSTNARVRDCVLPDVWVAEGQRVVRQVRVRGSDLKLMLLMIDSYVGRAGSCWASIDSLAARCTFSRRKAIRTLKGLEKLGLLTERDERRGSRNFKHRRPCTARVAEFSVAATAPETNLTVPQETFHGATGESHSATGNISQCHSYGTRIPIGNSIRKPPSEAPTREQTAAEPGVSPAGPTRPQRLPRGVGWGFRCLSKGWCLRTGMQPTQLADSASISVWFAAAVERELVTGDPDGARLFFALCRYVWRKRREKARPIGFLHALLEARRPPYWWDVIGNDDEEWARAALVALRGDRRQTPAAPDPEAAQAADDQQRKRAMIAQLRAAFPNGAANR